MLSLTAAAGPGDAPTSQPYSDASLNAVVNAGLGFGLIGYDLVGELGAETLGVDSFLGQRWLLQWDGLLAFRSAILANTYPLTSFFGGASHGFVEGGVRLIPESDWSPYLGVRLGGTMSVMANPGTPLVKINTLNVNDGFGGISADASGRLAVGASLLERETSLVASAFVQEARFSAGVETAGLTLTEVGLAGRLDLRHHFIFTLDALVGFAPTRTNEALQVTEHRLRLQAAAGLRRTFANGLWLGIAASYARDRVRTVYTSSSTTYDSVYPGVTVTSITLGVPLWRQR